MKNCVLQDIGGRTFFEMFVAYDAAMHGLHFVKTKLYIF